MTHQHIIVAALLETHGRTFAAELGARVARNTPSPLFRLLCLAMLTGAPVQADIAMRGARALADAGWTTPHKLANSRWSQRVAALNEAGYARVDERTATQLEVLNERLLDEYGGDLRRLRAAANGEASLALEQLRGFKGIGEVGASIFLREVQAAWPEFYPFIDKATAKAAGRLGLPTGAGDLARLVDAQIFPRLVAAIVRTQLAGDFDRIRDGAG
ncbi:hypothetical protein SADO_07102 [Salinisphaera dokdonensis CL-ES53]|uniref:Endonuclease n=1 Tax=Salinisphaera dokdonensis CL-ES53 TaxID=1304272 RepID=A0ABV2B0V1_9GAMM